jgi:hypothetical protein
VAIYPACNNGIKTSKVTVDYALSMGSLRRLRRTIRLAAVALVVAAVATELAKPEAERTWEGRVFGLVPYDFRPPTWERIRGAYWNPESDRLFTDRVWGVGWAVNLHRAKVLLESAFERLMGTPSPLSIRMSPRPPRVGGGSDPGKRSE